MNTGTTLEDNYAIAARQRQQCLLQILESTHSKKLVVPGPGTGKAFLFRILLPGKKRSLTLTLVNRLAEDLSLELCARQPLQRCLSQPLLLIETVHHRLFVRYDWCGS